MLSLYPVFIIWIIKLWICWRYLQGLNHVGLIKSLSAANIASNNQLETSCTWQERKGNERRQKFPSRANKNLDESAGTQPEKNPSATEKCHRRRECVAATRQTCFLRVIYYARSESGCTWARRGAEPCVNECGQTAPTGKGQAASPCMLIV